MRTRSSQASMIFFHENRSLYKFTKQNKVTKLKRTIVFKKSTIAQRVS